MIARIWHGWTTRERANLYEQLLREDILPNIAQRKITGYRGARLLRRNVDDGVEFLTILNFDSHDAVRAFAGEDSTLAVVPQKARELLTRFEMRSKHYNEVPLE